MHIHEMKLATYLTDHEFTDASFAGLIGCDRTTVSRLRRELTRPTWDQAERIRAATNGLVSPNDFLPAPEREGEAA